MALLLICREFPWLSVWPGHTGSGESVVILGNIAWAPEAIAALSEARCCSGSEAILDSSNRLAFYGTKREHKCW